MKKILWWVFASVVWLKAEGIYTTFEVEALQEARLAMSATGVIDALHVKVGQKVAQGDLLVRLASEVEQAEVALAKTKVAIATLAYTHAKQEFARYEALKGVIDEERYEHMRFAKNNAALELEEAQQGLAAKEKVLALKYLYAPFDGVVSEVFVELGEGVGGPASPLLTLLTPLHVKLIFSFDQRHWAKVHKGQKVVYRVDGETATREGVIVKVYPSVDAERRMLKAEVLAEGILPGLFGEGTIEVQ